MHPFINGKDFTLDRVGQLVPVIIGNIGDARVYITAQNIGVVHARDEALAQFISQWFF